MSATGEIGPADVHRFDLIFYKSNLAPEGEPVDMNIGFTADITQEGETDDEVTIADYEQVPAWESLEAIRAFIEESSASDFDGDSMREEEDPNSTPHLRRRGASQAANANLASPVNPRIIQFRRRVKDGTGYVSHHDDSLHELELRVLDALSASQLPLDPLRFLHKPHCLLGCGGTSVLSIEARISDFHSWQMEAYLIAVGNDHEGVFAKASEIVGCLGPWPQTSVESLEVNNVLQLVPFPSEPESLEPYPLSA